MPGAEHFGFILECLGMQKIGPDCYHGILPRFAGCADCWQYYRLAEGDHHLVQASCDTRWELGGCWFHLSSFASDCLDWPGHILIYNNCLQFYHQCNPAGEPERSPSLLIHLTDRQASALALEVLRDPAMLGVLDDFLRDRGVLAEGGTAMRLEKGTHR